MRVEELIANADSSYYGWVFVGIVALSWIIGISVLACLTANDETDENSVAMSLGTPWLITVIALIILFTLGFNFTSTTNRSLAKEVHQEYSLNPTMTGGLSRGVPDTLPLRMENAPDGDGEGEITVHLDHKKVSFTDDDGNPVPENQVRRLSKEQIEKFVKKQTRLEHVRVIKEEPYPSLYTLENGDSRNDIKVEGDYKHTRVTTYVTAEDGELVVSVKSDRTIDPEDIMR